MQIVSVTRLEGSMRIAFKTEDKLIYARALEFDLVGVGATRETARQELQDLFKTYLEACLAKPGKVRFLFPAEPEEWNNPDIESYDVVIEYRSPRNAKPLPPRASIRDLKKKQQYIQSVGLLPV